MVCGATLWWSMLKGNFLESHCYEYFCE
jgi:hypothetical protein